MLYCIYGLADPRKPEIIKYVGQTKKILKVRRDRHVSDSLRHLKQGRKPTHKEYWILSLHRENIKPEIAIIEENIEEKNVNERECYWIAHYRNIGQATTNFKDGGTFTKNNLKEIWERKNKEKGIMTVEERKEFLLSLPKGSPRPPKKENFSLMDFCSKTKNCYDQEFDNKIREKFPHWFNENRMKMKKEYFLSFDRDAPRPDDFEKIKDYMRKDRSTYDEDFSHKVKEKYPHWFAFVSNTSLKEISTRKKKELISLPDDAARPSAKTKLGSALCDYTSSSKKSFDEEFNKSIRKKFPNWFKEDRVALNMKTLFEMPEGSPKPRKDSSIGNALRTYTKADGKSYREEFDLQIRARHPNWFSGKWYKIC